MNKWLKNSIAVASLLLLVACESTLGTKDDTAAAASAEKTAGTTSSTETAKAKALVGSAIYKGHPLDDPKGVLSSRVIYFDFDKSDIKKEFRDLIEAHARYLASNSSASVVLEGHADERGSREYNIGLGERRATTVRRQMVLLGAAEAQLQVLSYGEERPAVQGHDESAWQLNRRVEINYQSR